MWGFEAGTWRNSNINEHWALVGSRNYETSSVCGWNKTKSFRSASHRFCSPKAYFVRYFCVSTYFSIKSSKVTWRNILWEAKTTHHFSKIRSSDGTSKFDASCDEDLHSGIQHLIMSMLCVAAGSTTHANRNQKIWVFLFENLTRNSFETKL